MGQTQMKRSLKAAADATTSHEHIVDRTAVKELGLDADVSVGDDHVVDTGYFATADQVDAAAVDCHVADLEPLSAIYRGILERLLVPASVRA